MTPGCFELQGAISFEDVPDVRRFIEKVQCRFVPSAADVSRVAMTAHELLENAIKYSADGTASLRIELLDGPAVRITTRNPVGNRDISSLTSLARQLQQCTDPMRVYVGLMASSPHTEGGLGRGRIAAEADMQIAVTVERGVVEVSASSPLTRT